MTAKKKTAKKKAALKTPTKKASSGGAFKATALSPSGWKSRPAPGRSFAVEKSIPNYFAELLRETLEDIAESQVAVSKATGIPTPHLTEMKLGRRRITPENDLRFSRYFGITPGYFLRLQLRFDLEMAEKTLGPTVNKEVIPA
ncbi:MAG: hypothetical protein O3A92_05225 [Verrucomicrobia bacterium]|nr:hypothetical protein [Verrucomicrobiota bacterium]